MTLNDTPTARTPGDAERSLREAGLRVTAPRVAIARCLRGDTTHPTAQEIFDRLRPTHPSMSFATVYNTLAALHAAGRVGRLATGGATRFDPKTEPHHHAICDACGRVWDLPAGREPGPAGLPRGFALHKVERIFRGRCAACHADARRGRRRGRASKQ